MAVSLFGFVKLLLPLDIHYFLFYIDFYAAGEFASVCIFWGTKKLFRKWSSHLLCIEIEAFLLFLSPLFSNSCHHRFLNWGGRSRAAGTCWFLHL